jgi:hypothetical protein
VVLQGVLLQMGSAGKQAKAEAQASWHDLWGPGKVQPFEDDLGRVKSHGATCAWRTLLQSPVEEM